MQIVIEIPEEVYKQQFGGDWVGNILIHDAIINGTLLPKGHGRLIDADILLKQPLDTANYPSNYIKDALTIIEADKAESEDKK